MAEIIIPNVNPNLVALIVWDKRDEGLEDTVEAPVIAWRIREGDYPAPICVDCDPQNHEASGYVVYDRAAKVGYSCGATLHGREKCVEAIRADIGLRCHNAKGAA